MIRELQVGHENAWSNCSEPMMIQSCVLLALMKK